MSTAPRIYTSVPNGPITTAVEPVAVVAVIRWKTAPPEEVEALAVAWTRSEVYVRWVFQGVSRQDWLPAADVRRAGAPATSDHSGRP